MAYDIQLAVTGPLAGMRFSRQAGVCVCPKCKKKKLNYDINKNVFKCFSPSCGWAGNGLDAYCFYTGIEDHKEAYKDYGERVLHDPKIMEKANKAVKEIKEVKETPLASIEERDFCYKTLFSLLTLNDEHKKALLRRGFEEKNLGFFRSLPTSRDEKISIASKLIEAGAKLDNIPGFFLVNGKWQMANSGGGILVPYFDLEGRIQGLQIRKDNAKDHKYAWFSSSYVPKWAKTYDYCTKAKTFTGWCGNWKDNKPVIPDDGVIYLTEGAMKAKLASILSEKAFLAIPGVKCMEELKKTLQGLKSLGAKKIIVAYDMDRFMNLDVSVSLRKIIELITSCGLECTYIKWSAEYVDFDREHKKLSERQFVYEYGCRDIPDVSKLKELGYEEVLFAFESSDNAHAGWDDYKAFVKYNKDEIKITPVFYRLHLKGIDDYYAFRKKGIK